MIFNYSCNYSNNINKTENEITKKQNNQKN